MYNTFGVCQTENIPQPKFTTPHRHLRAGRSPQQYSRQSLAVTRDFLTFFRRRCFFAKSTAAKDAGQSDYTACSVDFTAFHSLCTLPTPIRRRPRCTQREETQIDYDPAKRMTPSQYREPKKEQPAARQRPTTTACSPSVRAAGIRPCFRIQVLGGRQVLGRVRRRQRPSIFPDRVERRQEARKRRLPKSYQAADSRGISAGIPGHSRWLRSRLRPQDRRQCNARGIPHRRPTGLRKGRNAMGVEATKTLAFDERTGPH